MWDSPNATTAMTEDGFPAICDFRQYWGWFTTGFPASTTLVVDFCLTFAIPSADPQLLVDGSKPKLAKRAGRS